MAYSSLDQYLKKLNIPEKRSDAAIQTYENADGRAWASNNFHRSILLHDIITRPSSSPRNCQDGDIDISGISKNECILKMTQLRKELDEIHDLYKEASKKVEALEGAEKENKKSQNLLRESQATIKAQENMINDLKCGNTEEYEKLLRERDALCNQLKNAEDLDEIRKQFKARANEADQMEEEIECLRRELEKCNKPGASGDKMKSDSTQSCNQCQSYMDELERLKQRIDLEEKRSTDSMAERNFLRQRTRTIDLLEAELILYKSKYEECDCKIRALKEAICKNDSAERLCKQSMCQLKNTESRLMDAECENDCLVKIIERLNSNLKERDLYIESLTKRLNEDCGISVIETTAKRAISYESITSGTVESIVKRISNASAEISKCKCNVSKCKCGNVSRCPSAKSSNCVKICASKRSVKKVTSKCSKLSEPEITRSQIDAMQIDKLLCEVRLLREQNCELERELNRVKNDLLQMSTVVDEVEKQRKSNEELQGALEEIKSNYTDGISEMSSKYQATVCEKISELHELESRLKCEKEKACSLEKKVSEICMELSHLQEYREKCCGLQRSLKCVENDRYEKSRDAELLMKDCQAYFQENQELKCQIDCLKCEIEELNAKKSQTSMCQREAIKKSVVEFKRHYDEKIQMIRCYEDKIKHLEMENENLRCSFMAKSSPSSSCDELFKKAAKFSLASLEGEELVELHDKIRRAMVDGKPKVAIHTEYSRIFDEICQKYKLNEENPIRDDFDTCSARTAPSMRSRAPKKSCLKQNRSKSSDLCKSKSFRGKSKRMQSR